MDSQKVSHRLNVRTRNDANGDAARMNMKRMLQTQQFEQQAEAAWRSPRQMPLQQSGRTDAAVVCAARVT
jgi:hypothetical protein